MDSNHNKQYQKLSYYRYTKWEKSIVGASILAVTTRFICFAESQGFEPQNLLQLPVFKTGAFNHSASFPVIHTIKTVYPDRSLSQQAHLSVHY